MTNARTQHTDRPGLLDQRAAALHTEAEDPTYDEGLESFDGEQFDREEREALRRVAGLSTELEDVTEVEYRQLRLERVVLAGIWTDGTQTDAENSLRELAALADGASRWQAFGHVALPLAWPGVLSGALMMWARGVSEFGAVVILAYHPKVVPVLVYERFEGFGLSAAQPVAAILIFAALLAFVALNLLARIRR